ncbi:LOW QUALITY PROTEIN: C-X-C chemokine receptor type 6 [Chlamydotis macqueenii]
MATIHAADFYNNFSIINPNDNGSENFHTFIRVFLPCMYSVVFILGLAGNALVFVILVFYEKLKMLTDIFLLNLAIADWVFVWTLPFWAYSAAQEWTSGIVACRIIRVYTLNLYTSMLTLTSITFDRLIAITFATKAHMCQTKRMTWGKLICVLIWVISLAFAAPQFIFSHVFTIDKTVCHEEYPNYRTELILEAIQLTLGYFIPMLAMIICYSLIIRTLLHTRSFQKNKPLKKIFSVVAVFILTQSPYTFLRLVKIIDWSFILNSRFEYAIIVTEALAYFHGCLNPVLYFFVGVKFKRNIQKIIKNSRCIKCQVTAKQWQTTEEEGSKTFTASNNANATSMYPL